MAEGKIRRRSGSAKPDSTHQQDPAAGVDDDVVRNAPVLTIKWTKLAILALFLLTPYLSLLYLLPIERGLMRSILINLAMSVVGFGGTILLIPVASKYVLRRNMFGYDINKRGSAAGKVKVPESLGLVSGIVFLVVAILFQHFIFSQENSISDSYPPENAWLTEYYAALASICFMIFLGFVDDVLDIPWRVKLFLPSIAALPLLMAYAGRTNIVIPKPLRPTLGFNELDLGWIYKLYMGLLAVFCTNSINILAGVNGLEVGQTVIISCAVLIHNVMQISRSEETRHAHAFSLYIMQPFVATSLGLLAFNWYPSSVFVGDTYTYFAGMALAVVGILGHFSETMLLFFLPQILNFLYSIPQLFKIVPCPRHRLPSFDPHSGLLIGSNDMNLVNLFLRWFGRCSEQQLCIRLLIFQVLCCGFCFGLRYLMAGWYK
ncbi:uncharacterized protein [Physcomitrium patens]|uniref:UDP-N-acetylglucosamine--dolichyl-phosphate N-acetylglucosaminephosphotransferase n=3 Tax=Physcomitrium patens TaxID=3218 RepID=A0A2K1L243_PHYPA|nr:UDP-N-acetylglucosamine--dolichyl-phosphate N-acetylglucosaminephosphotransferase-like isoform X1 [Physcomitrium patens]PNR60086.1 hypothetical protein PHYPA_002879 [Physcomitrium patens]|eukprot:XP_024369052.1 UDP-N-acetylglucosamine--dolichyl-phosphate N-acetylglucosaminephosphotransferase-like isoform X1 [Physcomitrella patens]